MRRKRARGPSRQLKPSASRPHTIAASVAHEIGNPLNALDIHLQLMERECTPPQSGVQPATPNRPRRGLRRQKAAAPGQQMSTWKKARKAGKISRRCEKRDCALDYIIRQFLEALRPAPARLVIGRYQSRHSETVELLRPEIDNRGCQSSYNLVRICCDCN